MTITARGHACLIVKDVLDKNLYVNLYTPKYLSYIKLSTSDKSRVTDLVMGSFRWKLFLESVIEAAANREISSLESDLVLLLRIGGYEILFGKTPRQILVSEWVNESQKFIGARSKGIANAVFRRISEKSVEDWQQFLGKGEDENLDKVWSHPKWIIEKYREVLTDNTDLVNLLKSNNEPPVNWLVNYATNDNTPRAALVPTATRVSQPQLQDIASSGNATARIQDVASQSAAFLLAHYDVKQNESKWLDACAAPGGKTATMAQERANDSIEIYAYDIHSHKQKLIENNTKNFKNIKIEISDARLSPWGTISFDRIMLDAPCTGLGAIRRRAESRWIKQPSMIQELVKGARELFDACFSSLKVNGLLEYVVCSPIKEETDDFVQWVKSNYENAKLIPPTDYISVFGEKNYLDLVDVTDTGLRFWPHKHQSDAMFIALFRKI
jgi:16S rRNA (cytosine967-C5)-methyltransferase